MVAKIAAEYFNAKLKIGVYVKNKCLSTHKLTEMHTNYVEIVPTMLCC